MTCGPALPLVGSQAAPATDSFPVWTVAYHSKGPWLTSFRRQWTASHPGGAAPQGTIVASMRGVSDVKNTRLNPARGSRICQDLVTGRAEIPAKSGSRNSDASCSRPSYLHRGVIVRRVKEAMMLWGRLSRETLRALSVGWPLALVPELGCQWAPMP